MVFPANKALKGNGLTNRPGCCFLEEIPFLRKYCMKRILPLIILTILGLLAVIIPGCDELVTKENTTYVTDTIIDSTCVAVCHSDISNAMSTAIKQWDNSAHSSDTLSDYTYFGRNTRICGPACHSTDGFVRSLNSAVDSVPYPSEIGCFACHHPHTTWDFALRDTATVTLASGPSYNRGHSNICARCHKATTDPAQAAHDSVNITLPWGPHGSTQADMLAGEGGYNFADTAIGNSSHTTTVTWGCITCHKEKSKGLNLGGHTFKLKDGPLILAETCNRASCHQSNPVVDFFQYDSLQVAYLATIDTLKGKLIESNLLDSTGLPVERMVTTADSAGALFNYLFVTGDKSNGVHNTKYGLTLMRYSLNYLRLALH